MDTPFNFTTGPTAVPDTGTLSYNGCTFGPLFETKVSSHFVPDAAKRTTKLVEHTIVADGYVTMHAEDVNIDHTMTRMYEMLSAPGGTLVYSGKALDLFVNRQGGGVGGGGAAVANFKPAPPSPTNDVAWGPVPELIEFQPLGGGLSAKVQWKVTVRLVPPATESVVNSLGLLQLNYETSVAYGEDGFSSLSIKGTIEIPMTRRPAVTSRGVPNTVDSFRGVLEERILRGIDLGRFRVTRRNFSVSRDKRTMDFDVEVEEKPYMDLPPNCTIAGGTYGVRPASAGPGLIKWLCTLRTNYIVRSDMPRSVAWLSFLALLRLRMQQSTQRDITTDNRLPEKGGIEGAGEGLKEGLINPLTGGLFGITKKPIDKAKRAADLKHRAWLIDFNFDEGVYRDSKTASFSATWRLTSNFQHILIASGIWKKVSDGGYAPGKNLWAQSMRDIMGSQSWLPNRLDPSLDVIVDFGSTGV